MSCVHGQSGFNFASVLRRELDRNSTANLAASLGRSFSWLHKIMEGALRFPIALLPAMLALLPTAKRVRVAQAILLPAGLVVFDGGLSTTHPLHASPGDDLVDRLLEADAVMARYRERVLRRQVTGIRDLLFELCGRLAACVGTEMLEGVSA